MITRHDPQPRLMLRLQAGLASMAQSWWQKRGLLARALYPLSCLTRLAVNYQQRPAAKASAWRAPVPIAVIGNIYVGGTGKTPVVIACARALADMGWKPGIVSRGYGVDIGPQPRVSHGADSTQQIADPELFGDEPALIAQESGCPIAVHPRRRLAIESLLARHPEVDVILSDDGLQHVEMGRDIEILVQDDRGVGNGWLLPAGPLREPIKRLNEVDAIITRCNKGFPLNADEQDDVLPMHQSNEAYDLGAPPKPNLNRPRRISMVLEPSHFRQVLTGKTISLSEMQAFAQNKTVGAAAGIGVPQRFFDTLLAEGIRLEWTRALPDHAKLDADIFSETKSDLIFITAKDAIKCRLLQDQRIWVMEVQARFSDNHFFPWLSQQLRLVVHHKHSSGVSTIPSWKHDC